MRKFEIQTFKLSLKRITLAYRIRGLRITTLLALGTLVKKVPPIPIRGEIQHYLDRLAKELELLEKDLKGSRLL